MNPSPTLAQLIDWTAAAGDLLRRGFGSDHDVHLKGRANLVTEMDRAAEDFLVARIRAAFPEHSIVTEESGLLAGSDQAQWFIDPLDGTTNYAHGFPFFCVSLAFAVHGEVILGVVYDPIRDEFFAAQRGQGATLNGLPLHVSTVERLEDSLLVTGFPYDSSGGRSDNLANFARLTQRSHGVRRLGSAALDACYVAAGRLDGFWEVTLMPWDVAAAGLIAAEAGAIVTTLRGEKNLLAPPCSILAAVPAIHAQMLALLAP